MKNEKVIDLVQDYEGAYVVPVEKFVRKSVVKKQKPPIVELVEGYKEGKRVMNELLKVFGGL